MQLLGEDESAAEVIVPEDGRVENLIDVDVDGATVLVSVTTSDQQLIEHIALVADGTEPWWSPDHPTPMVGEAHPSVPPTAWWGQGGTVPSDPAWLLLPDAPADTYGLAAPESLSGSALTVRLHPAESPSRADLVGSWDVLYGSATRGLGLQDDGTFERIPPDAPLTLEGTWSYSDGELQLSISDSTETYRAARLPEGRLALVATNVERVLKPPNGEMALLEPTAG